MVREETSSTIVWELPQEAECGAKQAGVPDSSSRMGKEDLLIFYAHHNDARALEYLAKNRWM